jgi:ABC-2 type transporter
MPPGAYRVSSFFVAKTLTTAPVEFVQTLFFSVIVYFMTGYQAKASKFFIYLSVMVMFVLTSETVGHLCAITTKNSHTGGWRCGRLLECSLYSPPSWAPVLAWGVARVAVGVTLHAPVFSYVQCPATLLACSPGPSLTGFSYANGGNPPCGLVACAGIIVVTMVLLVVLSFSGYLVVNIPVYFAWIGKISYFSYAYAALVRMALVLLDRSSSFPGFQCTVVFQISL